MENEYFKEIMETLKEIAVEQATLKERVESQLKISSKTSEEIMVLSRKVEKHDSFMTISLWAYGLVVSLLGYKYFNIH